MLMTMIFMVTLSFSQRLSPVLGVQIDLLRRPLLSVGIYTSNRVDLGGLTSNPDYIFMALRRARSLEE